MQNRDNQKQSLNQLIKAQEDKIENLRKGYFDKLKKTANEQLTAAGLDGNITTEYQQKTDNRGPTLQFQLDTLRDKALSALDAKIKKLETDVKSKSDKAKKAQTRVDQLSDAETKINALQEKTKQQIKDIKKSANIPEESFEPKDNIGQNLTNTVAQAAQTALQEAQTALQKAQEQLQQAKTALKTEKDELTKAQEAKKDFQAAVKTANERSGYKNAQNELKNLQNEYNKLEAAGAKIVEAEQKKFLQHMIQAATLAKINGTEVDLKTIAGQYQELKDKSALTEAQQKELEVLTKAFSQDANKQEIEGLKNAIEAEVEKGVAALKKSNVWRRLEATLDTAERQYASWKGIKSNGNVLDQLYEQELKTARNAIELQYGKSGFSFKQKNDVDLSADQKAVAKQLLSDANEGLENLRNSQFKFNLETQFNNILNNVEQNPQVQNLFQKIVEAIKLRVKQWRVNNAEDRIKLFCEQWGRDLSEKQEKGVKAIQPILGSFTRAAVKKKAAGQSKDQSMNKS